ncbi:two-component system, chemotaxis family, response regulator CheB [Reichenbachiella agariperforans]|uniref:Protein-glutamate methylesterase/protein-glutamine glutaminase n=1 Tax=Reichenbachiella agariperforans TaxID=156994 RepID=A0A1M6T072_REIAG|nr:chemotaxis response regulator protein-glutamate methylesterase [Reichenbachiella agariperforans]SHK50317.1 two-component system, chemotaxis family, response regulator CheB [Reichenbachiella agariperforans]
MSVDKIKILIIDDSRSVQKMLEYVFAQSDELEVIGVANDAYEAVDIMRKVKPNVILLDVRMPKMDGLTFLKKLMNQHPIPVIVFSSLITKNPEIGVKALEYGAVEVIDKPVIDYSNMTTTLVQEEKLLQVVHAVGREQIPSRSIYQTSVPKTPMPLSQVRPDTVVCIGASAGGTQAIKHLLSQLPDNFPPIVVVQHMPVEFTGQYARYLDSVCPMEVAEAVDQETLRSGKVYISPGDRHLTVEKYGGSYRARLFDGPKVSGHKPSVDRLFQSVTGDWAKYVIGVILTGMGKDGAIGMLGMHTAGSHTIAQDEDSCVVFGMPKEAIALQAVDQVCPLDQIPQVLMKLVMNKTKN